MTPPHTTREECEKCWKRVKDGFIGHAAKIPCKCECHSEIPAVPVLKEGVAYGPYISEVRKVLAKHQNEWKNEMLVELAELCNSAHSSALEAAKREISKIIYKGEYSGNYKRTLCYSPAARYPLTSCCSRYSGRTHQPPGNP